MMRGRWRRWVLRKAVHHLIDLDYGHIAVQVNTAIIDMDAAKAW